MLNQSNTSDDIPRTVQDIIHVIETKSAGGGYIYRGEPKLHNEPPYNGKVSSSLWREYGHESENFNIEVVEKEMLTAAKKHIGMDKDTDEANDLEILTQIQHYGGKTNLIDFTTDYFIALLFACDGHPQEDGRIILQKVDSISNMIMRPQNPQHRVMVQKSRFLRAPKGFIQPHENDIVTILSILKHPLLEHLRNYHDISRENIYNDLHGFIKHQFLHGGFYTHFYRGTACEKNKEYEKAIEHYTNAIQLDPFLLEAYTNRAFNYKEIGQYEDAIKDCDIVVELNSNDPGAYYNRSIVYDAMGEVDKAIKDLTKVIELDPDSISAYNDRGLSYKNKGEFDNAIKDYNKAIELDPHNAILYNNRGSAYLDMGKVDRAIEDCTKAINLIPNFAPAHLNLTKAYHSKGEVYQGWLPKGEVYREKKE